MRKLVVALVLLVAVTVAVVAACGGSGVPRGAIAKVGSGTVTKADFDKIMTQATAQATASGSTFPKAGTPEYKGFEARVVNYLVELELVRPEGRRSSRSRSRRRRSRTASTRSTSPTAARRRSKPCSRSRA